MTSRWYLWLTVLVLVVGGIGLAVTSAVRSYQRQQQQTQHAVCEVVVAQDNVYREASPSTRAGAKAAEAWHDLRQLFKCDGE